MNRRELFQAVGAAAVAPGAQSAALGLASWRGVVFPGSVSFMVDEKAVREWMDSVDVVITKVGRE